MVQEIQFDFDPGHKCEVQNCTNNAFLQSSHCGKLLCLPHFIDRECFHSRDGNEDLTLDFGRASLTDSDDAGTDAPAVQSSTSRPHIHDELRAWSLIFD